MGYPSGVGILYSNFGGVFLNFINFLEKKCIKLKVVFCYQDFKTKIAFFQNYQEDPFFLHFYVCFYSKTKLKVEIPWKCEKVRVRH